MRSQLVWQSPGAPTPCAADHCWLEDVQLMAVQPACLVGVPEAPALQQLHLQPHMQQAQQPGHLPAGQHDAAAGQIQDPHHQEASLLLHLQAVFRDRYNVPSASHTEALPEAITAGSPLLPLQLTQSALQLLVLSPDMHVLHHLQYDLLPLVLQQQGQATGEQPMVVEEASTQQSTAAAGHPADQQQPDTSISKGSSAQEQQESSQATGSLHADQSTSVGGCSSAGSSGESSTWTMPLYLQVRFPAQTLGQLMYALRLVLAVTSAAHRQQDVKEAGVGGSSTIPGLQAVAEVPLLVLPAVAQQEVQQLLLPAMRQEVQAEQQQQQPTGQLQTTEEVAKQSQYVEHMVWTHFCSLANDICLAVQLSQEYQAQLANVSAGPSTAVLDASATETVAAADTFVGASETAAPPLTVAVVSSPTTALEQVASTLLFPLLLPFLAAHGLHNMLHLLISCLPSPLQEQWQLQQATRLIGLQQTAPQAQTWATVAAAEDLQPEKLATIAEVQEKSTGYQTPGSDQPLLDAEAEAAGSSGLRQRHKQQQREASSRAAAVAGEDASLKPASRSTASSGPGAASDAMVVPWYAPLAQFPPQEESRYIVWKQQRLAFVDYFAAVFGLMYLVVLLKRSLSEPTTLFYCLVILIKTLPHVPLIAGCTNFFNRHRELLLFMVAPVTLVTFFWFVLVQRTGDPEAFLPQKAMAAYWSSHGELATSAIRPFTFHMRLRPYIVFCVLDAVIMMWLFGKVYGLWAAGVRWGFACVLSIGLSWALDLRMRRGLPSRQRSG